MGVIWKAQCTQLYKGKQQPPTRVLRLALMLVSNAHRCKLVSTVPDFIRAPNLQVTVPDVGFYCWVDGSFATRDQGGAAYMLMCGRIMVQYEFQYTLTFTPFQMEANTLLMGMHASLMHGATSRVFYTDSQ